MPIIIDLATGVARLGKKVKESLDMSKEASLLKAVSAPSVATSATLASEDAEASFIGKTAKTFHKGALALAKKMEDRGANRDEIWKATGDMDAPTFKDVDGNWKQEISDKGAGFPKSGLQDLEAYGWRKQGRIYKNPEMFKAYPDLAEISTGPLSRFDAHSSRGSYDFARNEILLNSYDIGDAVSRKKIAKEKLQEVGSVNQHELQHAIQDREGFARGGRPDEFAADKNFSDAHESYKRLAGEAEARNVQTRLNMGMAERKANPPWTTLDVDEKDLLVRHNKKVNTQAQDFTQRRASKRDQWKELRERTIGAHPIESFKYPPVIEQTIEAPKSQTLLDIASAAQKYNDFIDKPLINLIAPELPAELWRKQAYGQPTTLGERSLAALDMSPI